MELDSLKLVLEETIELLLSGNEMAFDGTIPAELAEELRTFVQKIEREEAFDRDYLIVLFLPTAPIQECSMANGWSENYYKIASRFDKGIEI
ncbi:MAG: hypothetical protein R8G66_31790 [Cytophagales bacterium]|nr:hypothetical protein [Cytophagales bacterium]